MESDLVRRMTITDVGPKPGGKMAYGNQNISQLGQAAGQQLGYSSDSSSIKQAQTPIDALGCVASSLDNSRNMAASIEAAIFGADQVAGNAPQRPSPGSIAGWIDLIREQAESLQKALSYIQSRL